MDGDLRDRCVPVTINSNAKSNSANLFMDRVSKMCVKHKEKHDSSPIDASTCVRTMGSLKQVLEKVEHQQQGQPPTDLCVLYDSILNCAFCPHSLTTFSNGSPVEVVPRVALLLGTTPSPSVHNPPDSPPLDAVCSTIALFLSKLSSPLSRRLAFSDLMSMVSTLIDLESSSPQPTFPISFDVFPSLTQYMKTHEKRPQDAPPPTTPNPIILQSHLNLYLLRKSLFEIISIILSPSAGPRTVPTSLASYNHHCLSNILSHILSFSPIPPPSTSSNPSDHLIYEANEHVHTTCLNLLVHVIPMDPPSYGSLIPKIVQNLHDHASNLSTVTQHRSWPLIGLVRLVPMLAPNPPSASSDAVASQLVSIAAVLSDNDCFSNKNATENVKFLARAILSAVYQMLVSHPDPRRIRPTSDETIKSICDLCCFPFQVCPGEACAVLATLFDENIDVPDLPSRSSMRGGGFGLSPSPKRKRLTYDSPSYASSQSTYRSNATGSPSFKGRSSDYNSRNSSLGEFFAKAQKNASQLIKHIHPNFPNKVFLNPIDHLLTTICTDEELDNVPSSKMLIQVAAATRILTVISWNKGSKQTRFIRNSLTNLLESISVITEFINVTLRRHPPDFTKKKPFAKSRMKQIFSAVNFAMSQIVYCNHRDPFPLHHPLHPNSSNIKSICIFMTEIFDHEQSGRFVEHCQLNRTFDNKFQVDPPPTLKRYSSISSAGTNATDTSTTQMTLPSLQTQLHSPNTQSTLLTPQTQKSAGSSLFCDKICVRIHELFSIPMSPDFCSTCNCRSMKGNPIMCNLVLEKCLRSHASVLSLFISTYQPINGYDKLVSSGAAYRSIPALIFSKGDLEVLSKCKLNSGTEDNLACIAANLIGIRGRILGNYGVDEEDLGRSTIIPLPNLTNWTNRALPDFSFEVLTKIEACGLLAKIIPMENNSLDMHPRLRLILVKTIVDALQSVLQDTELSETKLPRFLHQARAEIFLTYFPFISALKSRTQIPECKPPSVCTPILYLVCAPFVEKDDSIRSFLQDAIPALLAANGGILLSQLFARYDEVEEAALNSPRRKSKSKKRKGVPQPQEVTHSFFKLFDFLMSKYSPLATSDVSFGPSASYNTASAQTLGASAASSYTAVVAVRNSDMMVSKFSALSVLGSLSIHSNPSNNVTSRVLPVIFEACLSRVIKYWLDDESEVQAFKTIMTIHEKINFSEVFSTRNLLDHSQVFVSVVRDLLLAFDGDAVDNQFYFLHFFMREFIYCVHSSQKSKKQYLETATNYLYPGFVEEEELTCLKRWAKYVHTVTESEETVENHYQSLIKANIPHIVTRIILLFQQAPIHFVLRKVLNDSSDMASVINLYSRQILKLLLEAFGQVQDQNNVIEKIKYAGYWRTYDHKSKKSSSMLGRQNSGTSQHSNASSVRPLENIDMMMQMATESENNDPEYVSKARQSDEDKEMAAKNWVKPNVMFLLHNSLYNYKNKDSTQKARAMIFINGVIRFLFPSVAALYMPKILSAVNIGMSDSSNDPKLRFFALKNLISFVKVLCDEPILKSNVEIVGQNLTSITVALLPIFSQVIGPSDSPSSKSYKKESIADAVSLFQYLVSGELGTLLKPYLESLPFLPNHDEFEPVKDSLRKLNIDLDEISKYSSSTVFPDEVPDEEEQARSDVEIIEIADNDESAGDGGAKSSLETQMSTPFKSSTRDGKYQVILQRRLKNLRSLVSHENVNVRKTVLHQLTSLVKENKRLFKKLVDSEESASTRFLTVVKAQPSNVANKNNIRSTTLPSPAANSSGGISILIQTLLDRCAKETDEDVKLALSQTLGEIGAIDPNKLSVEKTNKSNETDTSTDQNNDLHWRLSQPPWNSSMELYSLRLLSNRLVVALKAALTTQDQDKVGHSIQEVLRHLSGKSVSLPTSQTASVTTPTSTEKAPTEISQELKDKLTECDVLTVIEPFLSTSFRQNSITHVSQPPFFTKDKSYHRWISSWSRFLIEKSCKNESSRWKSMFAALNSAVRVEVGLSVAEFLLPLLILDVACFGEDDDLAAIINEIRLVFDVSSPNKSSSDHWSVVCADDHRRAVNTVFMVLETLEYWTEKEIEKKYLKRSSSGRRSSASSASSFADSSRGVSWPVDEGIERIQNISSQITLQMRADAAIKVGAHARALKYLELDARLRVVDFVYNPPDEELESMDDFSKGTRLGNTLAPIPAENLGKMQMLLGKLDDVDGMCSMSMYDASSYDGSLVEQIFQKEVIGDWAGALQGYEQAIILHEAEVGDEMGRGSAAMDIVDDDDSDYTIDHADNMGETVVKNMRSKQLLEKGLLRSLLHLGQLESVLNQVGGMMNRKEESEVELSIERRFCGVKEYLPNAVEAAWRLQKWPLLTELLEKQDQIEEENLKKGNLKKHRSEEGMDPESKFQIGVGRAMLGLHEMKKEKVKIALDKTRIGLMEDMSNVARESYSRSLDVLLKFHCLHEIEQSTEILCKKDKTGFLETSQSCGKDGWDWSGRLSNLGRGDSDGIITVRLALAKLANAKALEGDLWLTAAKRARKSHHFHIAEPALSRSLAAYSIAGENFNDDTSKVMLQIAKVKHVQKKTSDALMIIEPRSADRILSGSDKREVQKLKKDHYLDSLEDFENRTLCATRWMVESNLKFGAGIVKRFKQIVNICKTSEKTNFYFARYCDGLVESRIASMIAGDYDKKTSKGRELTEELEECSTEDDKRVQIMKRDPECHRYINFALKYYGIALAHGDKHMYQALPRMLTMWFEVTSIPVSVEESQLSRSRGKKQVHYSKRQTTEKTYTSDVDRVWAECITSVTKMMSAHGRSIPEHIFYSALPQLISRIAHPHADTQTTTVKILKKVLVAYPRQAMWGLAWLRYSHSSTRKSYGEEIFREAASTLRRTTDNDHASNLLMESIVLFKMLKSIADNDRVSQGKTFALSPLRFNSNSKITLQDFVPPVQAALSMNVTQRMNRSEKQKRQKGVVAEVFPQYVPRMESFSEKGTVFNTKAKPKKITAYAVGQRRGRRGGEGRVGEIHFLVKKENKGDLRKDARVQDLNNVLNRLLVGGGKKGGNGGRAGQRRLQLRTYSVTCLSEDTGIMEWVPKTVSLRNVISDCVNCQVDAENPKRRGGRVTEFGRRALREQFVRCQELYVNQGKLTKAAEEFERLMLKPYPPVLYWWFIQEFQDPHDWYDARRRFTLSAAVWSAVGHILGLGDRHTENILVETSCGEVVHVDFDCLFDKALKLARPEVVPFRLTANMIDAMGSVGYEGAFRGGLIETLTVLRDHRELLLAMLQPFLLDPVISWKKSGVSGEILKDDKGLEIENTEARKNIQIIDGRLRGVYNLVNPNYKKIKRIDKGGEVESEGHGFLPLGVEGQAHKLILEATSTENLVQMYVGWMSWV